MSNDVLLVPINIEQPNVEAQSDVVVYVPQAHKNKAGIVKEGEGINIENGVVSLDQQTVEDMIDANKWVSYGFQQNLTEDEKGMARHNIGAGDNDFTGSYYDVTQKPHLNTDNSVSLPIGDEEINNTINLHKVSKTGSFDDLNDVPTETIDFAEAERQKSKNLFDLSRVKFFDGVSVDLNNNSFSFTSYNTTTQNFLKEFADLEVGKTYRLSATSDSSNKIIYFSAIQRYWHFNDTVTITQEMLDSRIAFYGTTGVEATVSNVMIIAGSVATDYQPYNGAIVHEKQLNEAVAKRSLLYQHDLAVSISASSLTTMVEYFDLFNQDDTQVYFARIGSLDNTKFRDIVGTPSGFGGYSGCFIKKEVNGILSTTNYDCYKLLAIDDYSNKTALSYMYKDLRGDIKFTGWNVIGG